MVISVETRRERREKISIIKKNCEGCIWLTSEGKYWIFFRSAAQTKFQDYKFIKISKPTNL